MACAGQPDPRESFTFRQQSTSGALCLPNIQVQGIFTIQPVRGDLSSGSQEENSSSLPVPSNPPSPQDWELYRDVFTQLYSHEGLPLREVRIIMERRYKFYAS